MSTPLNTKPRTSKAARPKRFVALARVSSQAQRDEGGSLETQEVALRAYASKEGGSVVKLWRLAETASKADRRASFKELMAYAKSNAASIDGLLVYKVDRAARNMTDYGRILELESIHGVPLVAVSQPTQNTPAGRMSRNMMAAMGTFFAEQLSVDVKEGLAQRVRDGWFPTNPPYGYISVRHDGRSTVKVESREAENVTFIFDLYAYHHCTIDMIAARLAGEGRMYTAKQPTWARSKIGRVLRDRSYIGDVKWHGEWQPGKHKPIVARETFARVQSLLGEKVYKANELLFGGELMTCGHCGRPVTGESVIKKQTGKRYVYYRCAGYTAPGHPRDRLREQDVDDQLKAVFAKLVQPEPVSAWFRDTLIASSAHQHEQARRRGADLQRQLADVRGQQSRLLNLHIAGTIDSGAFAEKNTELRDLVETLAVEVDSNVLRTADRAERALKVFELSQSIPQTWLTADYSKKRQIIEMVCLNLVLKGASIGVATRKPFNALAEGLCVSNSGERGIRTPDTIARIQHFQCCSFGHSDISPEGPGTLREPSGDRQTRATCVRSARAGRGRRCGRSPGAIAGRRTPSGRRLATARASAGRRRSAASRCCPSESSSRGRRCSPRRADNTARPSGSSRRVSRARRAGRPGRRSH